MDEVDATGLNTDELFQQMHEDELSDATLITPVDFAHIRPITPQLVYYRIRKGDLATYTCSCGRKCLNREEADEFFRKLRGENAWPYGRKEGD